MKNKKDTEFLSTLRKRVENSAAILTTSRINELDDLKFYAGSPDNQWQWPDNILTQRSGMNQGVDVRPCLTINKLPQHVKQITNDMRQNMPSGKVIPVSDGADEKVAEKFNGLIRHIEYISDADIAYQTACEFQVIHGEGYWRIITEYIDDKSFDLEAKILPIHNSFSVTLDPFAKD